MKQLPLLLVILMPLSSLGIACSSGETPPSESLSESSLSYEEKGKYFLYLKNCDLLIPFPADSGRKSIKSAYCEIKVAHRMVKGDTLELLYHYIDPTTSNPSPFMQGVVAFDTNQDTVIVVSEGLTFFEGNITMPNYEEYLDRNKDIVDSSILYHPEAKNWWLKSTGFLFVESEHLDCIGKEQLDPAQVNPWFFRQLEAGKERGRKGEAYISVRHS